MKRKILFLTGSSNQTSQMQQIAQALSEYDCWFSQAFSDSIVLRFLIEKTPLLNRTILSTPYRQKAEALLKKNNQQIDYRALSNDYDLIVCCSDMVIPERLRQQKTIWVQEGMIDKYTLLSQVVQKLKLPPYWCFNTSLNGATNKCDLYCCASEGYKKHLARRGTDLQKIVVTGIPNYDHIHANENNDFPYRNYVMVATSDIRETARLENRIKFIKKAVKIANGRPMIFKLHPNEKARRAIKEIKKYAPKTTIIFQEGNTQEMIANCTELITQYSTVVYTGIVLGKKVHSWFDLEQLLSQTPLQNNGTSALNIAAICRQYIEHKGSPNTFLQTLLVPTRVKKELVEIQNA